ncbi:hypothetical protein JG687_00000464 [Phytophthora cactorum]|uniref:Uncharacterized protein n=1 Tax=Phytophthora cactorum TaxID=29920 RepID=A0A8T1V2R1_9STRA|nr:hypothetical protein JG687_00000464 [Phytophthora cactorum]
MAKNRAAPAPAPGDTDAAVGGRSQAANVHAPHSPPPPAVVVAMLSKAEQSRVEYRGGKGELLGLGEIYLNDLSDIFVFEVANQMARKLKLQLRAELRKPFQSSQWGFQLENENVSIMQRELQQEKDRAVASDEFNHVPFSVLRSSSKAALCAENVYLCEGYNELFNHIGTVDEIVLGPKETKRITFSMCTNLTPQHNATGNSAYVAAGDSSEEERAHLSETSCFVLSGRLILQPSFVDGSVTSRLPIPEMLVPLQAQVCRSLLRLDVKELHFDDCVPGGSFVKDFTVWNRSEIPLLFKLVSPMTPWSENNELLVCTDYNSGYVIGDKTLQAAAYGHVRIRVTYRPTDIGERFFEIQAQNLHDSRNVKTLRIHAITNQEHHREGLSIKEPDGSYLMSGSRLDFGDCYTGIASSKVILMRNMTEVALHVELTSDRPKEVTFELKLQQNRSHRAKTLMPFSNVDAYGLDSDEEVDDNEGDFYEEDFQQTKRNSFEENPMGDGDDLDDDFEFDREPRALPESPLGSPKMRGSRGSADLRKKTYRTKGKKSSKVSSRVRGFAYDSGVDSPRSSPERNLRTDTRKRQTVPVDDNSASNFLVEIIDLPPGVERTILIWYSPASSSNLEGLHGENADAVDLKAARLTKQTFRMSFRCFLMQGAWQQAQSRVYDRTLGKSIHIRARTCTSMVTVSPSILHLGDCNIGELKSSSCMLTNHSELPTVVKPLVTSKVISTVPNDDMMLGPKQSTELKIEIIPRKTNPNYSRLISIINMKNKSNIPQICVRSSNMDAHHVIYHSLFYKLLTQSRSAFLNFEHVAINSIKEGEVGVVKAFGTKEICFQFQPTLAGPFEEKLKIINVQDPENSVSVTIKAKVVKRETFKLLQSGQTISFGKCIVGEKTDEVKIAVRNTSRKKREYVIQLDPSFTVPTLRPTFYFSVDETPATVITQAQEKKLDEELEKLEHKLRIAITKKKTDKIVKLNAKISQVKALLSGEQLPKEPGTPADSDPEATGRSGGSSEVGESDPYDSGNSDSEMSESESSSHSRRRRSRPSDKPIIDVKTGLVSSSTNTLHFSLGAEATGRVVAYAIFNPLRSGDISPRGEDGDKSGARQSQKMKKRLLRRDAIPIVGVGKFLLFEQQNKDVVKELQYNAEIFSRTPAGESAFCRAVGRKPPSALPPHPNSGVVPTTVGDSSVESLARKPHETGGGSILRYDDVIPSLTAPPGIDSAKVEHRRSLTIKIPDSGKTARKLNLDIAPDQLGVSPTSSNLLVSAEESPADTRGWTVTLSLGSPSYKGSGIVEVVWNPAVTFRNVLALTYSSFDAGVSTEIDVLLVLQQQSSAGDAAKQGGVVLDKTLITAAFEARNKRLAQSRKLYPVPTLETHLEDELFEETESSGLDNFEEFDISSIRSGAVGQYSSLENTRYLIDVGQHTVRNGGEVEWEITIESLYSAASAASAADPGLDSVEYRLMLVDKNARSWLQLSRERGTLDRPHSYQSVVLYFLRGVVGVYSTFMVLQNLANPSDLKVIHVRLEVIADLNSLRGMSSGLDAATNLFRVLVSNHGSPKRLRRSSIEMPPEISAGGAQRLMIDLSEVYYYKLYQNHSIVIENSSGLSLDFILSTNARPQEVSFSVSPLSFNEVTTVTLGAHTSMQVFLHFRPQPKQPVLPSASNEVVSDVEMNEPWVREIEVYVSCRLVKDFRETVIIRAICSQPQLLVQVANGETNDSPLQRETYFSAQPTFLGLVFPMLESTLSSPELSTKAADETQKYLVVRNTKSDSYARLALRNDSLFFSLAIDDILTQPGAATVDLLDQGVCAGRRSTLLVTIQPQSVAVFRVKPDVAALWKHHQLWDHSVKEHVTLYNIKQFAEHYQVTLCFSCSNVASFYIPPNISESYPISALEDIVAKFLQNYEYTWKWLISYHEKTLVSAKHSGGQSSPASKLAEILNDLENALDLASPLSPRNLTHAAMQTFDEEESAQTTASRDDLYQLVQSYRALYFDFYYITDELVWYGVRGNAVRHSLALADLAYGVVFDHEVFRSFVSDARSESDVVAFPRLLLPWIRQLGHFLSFFPENQEATQPLRQVYDQLRKFEAS